MASYPYTRVAHLTGLELADWQQPRPWAKGGGLKTPTTLTGCPQSVQSYALTIGYTDNQDRGWWVHPDNNSPTTNRHIRALMRVLEANGYRKTDEYRDDSAGMGRTIRRYLWVKEA
jgi:hypothetical protein